MLLRLRRLVRAASLWGVVVGLLVFTSGVANATPAHNTNTLGLVGAWEFTGDASDVSGNGNDGVVHGATLTTDRFGNADSAYSFDAVDDFIRVAESIAGLAEYTQSAWVNLGLAEGAHSGHAILTTPNGTLYWQHDPRILNIVLIADRQGGVTSNPSTSFKYTVPLGIADETWFHLAVTAYSNNTADLFINGVEVDPGTRLTDTGGTGDVAVSMIGAAERSNKTPPVVFQFSGSIDDVYIYNRALSPSEVATLFAVPEPSTALLLGIGLAGLGMRRRRLTRRGC